ncbi:sigma-70 family RNA polymerase sigma factor [Thermosynechococcus sp. JY1334]|uniref:sigma-70 family RNA polymerase sigma factor n=1 Tax=unclassified Thermosynechococcus TaxID=2622553 RepID=UPI002673BA52|nr:MULTISPECIES: sigma-70 family RNA polymerase sigma factor [unclassified Thermosynechococcus]MDR7898436.1 sigma-70 family RNA polymerase sigma factor [Thermosynechococcus sp. JY1332]MDR7905838.1 sigma-70 family RNA polymerase sigma factor [Thermosynechococcus sp. JY1334]WKT85574.1 sigma-70 family RNA polymerase sigma factor [Thermosynechococcus sp. JY1339]WNC54518.1 sigma-70 family RNA polymerase sigma factor [Thermosynechococcus sp. JY1331]
MTRQPCDKLIALLRFDGSDRPRWYRDRQLQAYFTAAGYNLEEPEPTAVFLLQQLQRQPNHDDAQYWRRGLFCYLQETSWSVAMTLREKLGGMHQVSDCFQQACCLTNDPLKLLSKFKPERGTRLSTYAYRRIYDGVYAALVGVRKSDWGLLKHSGLRSLSSALGNQGYTEDRVRQICALVELWQELADQTTAPDQALLAQVAKTYRQCCPDLPAVTPSEVETLLRTAIAALRAYRQPQVVNPAEQRFWDTLEGGNTPWEATLKQEEQETLKRVFEMMKNAIAALDDTSRQVFCLYYCEQVSQQQIAQHLGFAKQYQVSRALERIRGHLAKAVLAGLNQPTHPERLKEATVAVNLWLKEGYKVLAGSCQRCDQVGMAEHCRYEGAF